jgi:TM2 domain-containing membrane protein YozV
VDPAAPFGRHPLTGEPLSDKSKTVAGLLQLIGIIGFVGFGRIYMGQAGLGIAQLLIGLIGGFVIGIVTCGVGFAIPVVWGVIDCIVLMTGSPRDSYGRPLRDGT